MFDFPASPSVGQIFAPASGPSWVWDGTVWKTSQTQGEMMINKIFIPGASVGATNYTYSKPANLRHLDFEGVAAGGSGGSAIATAASTFSFSSGGGGGAWGKKTFRAAELPASVALVIGQPGQPSASGAGNTAADTTFGSLITLPGGLRGNQGANTLYSSCAMISGSGYTAMPSGVDVGCAGGSSDACTVSLAGNNTASHAVWAILGKSGDSHWGVGYPAQHGTGYGPSAGRGWGSGSTGCLNSGSAGAAVQSVAGQPGAVLLTEYLAVAPADVVAPVRQSFLLGTTGVIVNVPPTAKRALIKGQILAATQPMYAVLQMSPDGTNFSGGATDYFYGGTVLFTGSSASPTKVTPVGYTSIQLTGQTDNLNVPIIFDCELQVNKPASPAVFGARSRGVVYNSAAANYVTEVMYLSWSNISALNTLTQLPAFRIVPGAGTFAAGSRVDIDWIY